MFTQDGLMRIFWPSDATRCLNSGTLLGWRNSESDLIVVSILEDAEVRSPPLSPSLVNGE